MEKWLRDFVRERSADRCEYCQVPQPLECLPFQPAYTRPFEPDHIVAEQHRGPTEAQNLCWSCWECNRHKGPNIGSVDPDTGAHVSLFNPRTDKWGKHFEWDGPELVGLTPVGRATVALLKVNFPPRIKWRKQLIEEGVFPP